MAARDGSLNIPVGEGGTEIQDLLADESDNQEIRYAKSEEQGKGNALIRQALDHLNEREREIFVERRLRDTPATLEELGVRYGVSRERIRQIEVKAFEKVKAVVQAGFLPAAVPALV
jgi:RNA polymerase sigma-32 factor